MTPFEYYRESGLADFGAYMSEAGIQYSPFLERTGGRINLIEIPSPHELEMPNTPKEATALDTKTQQFFEGKSIDEQMVQRQEFLKRYNITSDDTGRWEREMERLRSSQQGRIRLELSRRYAERYETLINFEGLAANQESIYIAEGDDPCDECADLAGELLPLHQRVNEGKMPSDRCLGGDACMCGLSPVD